MIYLNKEKTIAINHEYTEISKNGITYKIGNTYPWETFKCLLKYLGKECDTSTIEECVKREIVEQSSDSPVPNWISQLKTKLKDEYGIESESISLEQYDGSIPDKILFVNRRQNGINRNGKYMLVLPGTPLKQIEHKISEMMWGVYGELSENKSQNIMLTAAKRAYGMFDKVYQFPRISNGFQKLKWSVKQIRNKKAVILAPNGYGKSSFLRSILFSALLNYLPSDECIQSENIRDIAICHGLDPNEDRYLPVYIDLKHFPELSKTQKDSYSWIYYMLSKAVGVDWDGNIDIDEFYECIKEYNKRARLLILIDGYDELGKEYCDELLIKLAEFQKNQEYGLYATTIIASRPHMYERNFRGYDQWIIHALEFYDDEFAIKRMIREYSAYDSNINPDNIYVDIKENRYLSGLINSPALLVDVIKGCINKQYNSRWEPHWIVEKTIEDMLKRFDSQGAKTFSEYGGGINYLYEYFATEYLRNPYQFDNVERFGESVYSIIQTGTERRVWDALKEMSEIDIIDLFFTRLSIVIWDGDRIKFLSDIISYHLAAKSLVRQLKNTEIFERIGFYLDEFGDYKYEIVIMVSTIIMYDVYGISYGDSKRIDVEDMVRVSISKYLKDKWTNADSKEKLEIQKCIGVLLTNCYGENVFTGRFAEVTTIDFMKEVVFTNIEKTEFINQCRKKLIEMMK